MKKILYSILLFAVLATLTGCNKHKKSKTPVVAPTDTIADTLSTAPVVEDIPVVVWTPQYTSASIKAQCQIHYNKQNISTAASAAYLADSIIILSVQPMLGIEMVRVEATPESAIVIDKINRRYARCSYEEVSTLIGQKADFRTLEQMLEEQGLTMPVGKEQTITYADITAQITIRQISTNVEVNATPCKLNNYTQTSLNKLLGGK